MINGLFGYQERHFNPNRQYPDLDYLNNTNQKKSPNPTDAFPQEIIDIINQLPADIDLYSDVLFRSSGSAHELKCTYPNGLSDTTSAYVTQNGNINVGIASSRNPGKNVELSYNKLDENQWRISNGFNSRDVFIHPLIPLNLIATLSWVAYSVAIGNIHKAENNIKGLLTGQAQKAHGPNGKPQGSQIPQILPEDARCLPHDFFCSNIPLGLGLELKFTSGQSSLKRYVPCVGFVHVDVSECCRQHDIDLWCAPSQPWASWANVKVIACVTQKLTSITNEAFDNASWLCKLGQIILNFFGAIIGAILGLITTIWQLVGEAVLFVSKLIDYAIQGVSFGAIELPQGYYDVLTTVFGWVQDPNLVGYDKDTYGRNLDSCLCGGTTPTVLCNDRCRNLCNEMGKPQSCFWCRYECEYRNGTLAGTRLITGPGGEANCCPGSAQTRGIQCVNRQQFQANCPTCSNCIYYCLNKNGRLGWELHKSHPQLNCCITPSLPTTPCRRSGGFR